MLQVFRGDSWAAFTVGREAVELCNRHGFTYYLAMANVLTGWAGAAQGDISGGLAQLRDGLDGMRRLNAEIRLPYYFALLAETQGRTDSSSEALASLSTGLAFASKNGEEWAVPELHRVHGDLLAAQGKPERRAPASNEVWRLPSESVPWRSPEDSRFLRTERPQSPPQNASRTPRRSK